MFVFWLGTSYYTTTTGQETMVCKGNLHGLLWYLRQCSNFINFLFISGYTVLPLLVDLTPGDSSDYHSPLPGSGCGMSSWSGLYSASYATTGLPCQGIWKDKVCVHIYFYPRQELSSGIVVSGKKSCPSGDRAAGRPAFVSRPLCENYL